MSNNNYTTTTTNNNNNSYNYFPKLLFQLYMTGWTLGFLYSVPPIRTKRNPLLAGLTIATVRGFLLNFGVYYAVKDAISPIMNNIATVGGGVASSSSAAAAFVWSPKVAFIARFMTTFASVIAVTKDLPDVDGDREYNISTFATRLGVSRIANVATGCLALNYIHAILTGVLHPVGTFNMIPMIGGHALLALLLGHHYGELQSDSLPSIKKYYKHIWDLFYLEYVLYTLI
jgi:homogentisate solanesyltransferase